MKNVNIVSENKITEIKFSLKRGPVFGSGTKVGRESKGSWYQSRRCYQLCVCFCPIDGHNKNDPTAAAIVISYF